MNRTANRLRHIMNDAAIASKSNPFEVMMNGLKEEFGCVSQRYDAIMDIALFYIADELDELQERAAGANNLRQQLESAEKKAERRKQYIGYLETALHDKNALLEQRGGTIVRLTAECSELRKQVPTETRPDSWELLEEDAAELDDMPCDFNAKDLIRRAKALAEAEVGR